MTRGRKACRRGDKCQPRNLGEALYCCVNHSELSPEEIASRIGISAKYLLNAANPDNEDAQFQARWVLPLVVNTKNTLPLRFLCEQAGGLFVAIPDVGENNDGVYDAFVTATSDLGEDGALIQDALKGDRVISADEVRQILPAIDRTATSVLALKQAVIEAGRRSRKAVR